MADRKVDFASIGMDKVEKEFVRFKSLMDGIGVEFFLVAGACLGLVRDGRLIEYDKDFDFGVMGEEGLYQIEEELYNYYDEVYFHSWKMDVECGKILWLKKAIGGYILPIEVQAHYIKDDWVYYNRDFGPTWGFRAGRVVWPKRLFNVFKKVSLRGIDFDVPNPPEDFLTIHYGEDWRVPKEYSDWRYGCKNIYEGFWV